MDQTPISYEFLSGNTYDIKGANTVWVKKNTSGGDKRAATLQIMVNADGIRRCKPLLIFKGADGKKNQRIQKEIQSYYAGVSVK